LRDAKEAYFPVKCVFWETLKSALVRKMCLHPMWAGTIQSAEGLDITKRQRKNEFSHFSGPDLFSLSLDIELQVSKL
jgi:hypothetical protein